MTNKEKASNFLSEQAKAVHNGELVPENEGIVGESVVVKMSDAFMAVDIASTPDELPSVEEQYSLWLESHNMTDRKANTDMVEYLNSKGYYIVKLK